MAVPTTICPGPRSTEIEHPLDELESHPIWTELRGPVTPDQHTDTITSTGNTTASTQYVYTADGTQLLRSDTSGGATNTTLYLGYEDLTLANGTVTGTRYYTINGTTLAERTARQLYDLYPDPQGTINTIIPVNQNGTTGTYNINNSYGQTDCHFTETVTPIRRYTDPYGNPVAATTGGTTSPTGGNTVCGTATNANWPNSRGYLNKPTDPTTTLTDVGARTYNASLGRFLSVDHLLNLADPQSVDGYSYAGNNPVASSDPSGLCPVDKCGYGIVNNGVEAKSGPAEPGNSDAGNYVNGTYVPASSPRDILVPIWQYDYMTGSSCNSPSVVVCEYMDANAQENQQQAAAYLLFSEALDRKVNPCNYSFFCVISRDIGLTSCMHGSLMSCAGFVPLPIEKIVEGGELIVNGVRFIRASDGTVQLADGIDQLILSGDRTISEGGPETKAGQEYQKHAARGELPQLSVGGPAAFNEAGGQLLRDIVTDPNMVVSVNTGGRFVGGFTVADSAGRLAVFDSDLNFQYFGISQR